MSSTNAATTTPVRVVTETPLKVGFLPAALGSRGWMLGLIVKGTFAFREGAPMAWAAAEAAAFPSGGRTADGSIRGAPVAPSDYVILKPRGEFTLEGTAHAPGGKPSTGFDVGVKVGSTEKRLVAMGARHWKPGVPPTPSNPEPFVSLPLDWRAAYGGREDADNPHGVGASPLPTASGGTMQPLPRLIAPGDRFASPAMRHAPVGFGPLGDSVTGRVKPSGSFDGDYAGTHWPGFPDDFDLEHFCEAPADQRLDGYFAGDEPVILKNLSAEHPALSTALPGLTVRAIAAFRPDGPRPARDLASPDVDVTMRLDTVHLAAEEGRAFLTWRGLVPISGRSFDDLQSVYLATEPLRTAAKPVAWHLADRDRLIAIEDQDEEPFWTPVARTDDAGDDTTRPLTETAQSAAADNPAAGNGNDAARDVDGLTSDDRARINALLESARNQLASAGVSEDVVAMFRPDQDLATVLAALGKLLPEADGDLEAKADAAARQRLKDDAARLGLSGEEFDRIFEAADRAANVGHDASEASEPSAVTTRWTRDLVVDWSASGQSLAGADLSRLDLSGLDLADADLKGALLEGAVLERTCLKGARLGAASLVDANLAGAVLAGATLAGADLSEVRAAKADFREADLTGASLSGADLEGATLTAALAHGADFTGVDLSDAILDGSVLDDADLSQARCDRARFRSASLKGARLAEASARGTDFTGADLTGVAAVDGADLSGAILAGACAPGVVLIGAVLDRVDARRIDMPGADLTGASLADADLSAADIRGGSLAHARLSGTRLPLADLLGVDFEGAFIRGADFRGANAFEAEFWEANVVKTDFSAANIARTKLVHPAFRDTFADNTFEGTSNGTA